MSENFEGPSAFKNNVSYRLKYGNVEIEIWKQKLHKNDLIFSFIKKYWNILNYSMVSYGVLYSPCFTAGPVLSEWIRLFFFFWGQGQTNASFLCPRNLSFISADKTIILKAWTFVNIKRSAKLKRDYLVTWDREQLCHRQINSLFITSSIILGYYISVIN